ncbi:NAD-dependent epimerase/dehydratase family protein [Sphaerotilus sp.]|uniref:NAD-dependent epimerase/dehydratase family protein n=1 Tax=Sphaerotilus sp. TaxID=2093942 RepID=UPI00260030CB|nr:NAD-dependent epimerase/dehydratase family protein [Sphaerotilus sp.]
MTTASAPRVLILGANGRFGAAATQAFAAAGWQVLAQVRRPPAMLPTGAQAVTAALSDTTALAAASGVRAVVYAANPVYTRWAADLLPMARQGMAVAERLGAVFMLPGNVYNFGADMPTALREDTPQTASTRKGRLRIALEAELQSRAASGRLRSTVIRAGDFFGSGSGTWLDQAITKSLAKGKLVYPGPTDRVHAWTYLPDLAQAFVRAATRPEPGPAFRCWHHRSHDVTGAELLDMIERLARELGLAPHGVIRRGGLPWGVIRAGGWVVPIWRELAEMAYLWEQPHTLDGRAMASALGPLPHTPLNVALRATLRR